MNTTTRRHPRSRSECGRMAQEVDDTQVSALHASGHLASEIARVTGFHKSTVNAALKRLGLQSHWGRRVSAGDRFGRYVVLREVDPQRRSSGVKVRAVLARCDCGTEKIVRLESLWAGTTVSCGCRVAEFARTTLKDLPITHGGSKTLLYGAWTAMKDRCLNPNNKRWPAYGGRGIRVCDRWLHDFAAFAADVGERPAGKTLDRVNNDGNYEPGNVRWATHVEQARNRRPRRVQP